MAATDFREPRYFLQWVTVYYPEKDGAAQLQVEPLRIRDSRTNTEGHTCPIVFEHTDPIVVEKMLKILNEG